ncbi:MAG: NAD(P)-dependent oxidoreductase [Sulfitobacter sp.]|nr:NAD(P)-dependent oxidoreductase [Sulfitobacter sp.]
METGIIGVGLMGQGIARNVLKGGHGLRFLEHPGNQPVDEIMGLGAVPCATPAAVVEGAEVIILCVTGSAQVEAVLTGPEGVLSALALDAVIVDCSTSLPDSTLAMAKATVAAGGHFLDAPMTRTAAHAQAGTLNLLVGGEAEVLARVAPVLDSFTEAIEHVGPVCTGHRMKLLHNYVSIGFMTLLAEAAAQSADAGVDPEVLVKVLGQGGGASVALDRLAPFITEGDRSGLPFFVSNALKDIDYYQQMSRAAGAQTRIADGVMSALQEAVEAGHGEAWLPQLIREFRRKTEG